MSKEGTPELTKSWVIVDSERPDGDGTSGVQEVTENEPHVDSDTDSISVISESGCSYKTDEEEFAPPETATEKQELDNDLTPEKEPEVEEAPEVDQPVEPRVVQAFDENKAIEKLLYFATSAVCAIILVGFSVAVQHYFKEASNVDIFDPEEIVFPHVQNLKSEERPLCKFNAKRKSQMKLDELENKIAKLQESDEIVSPVRDNDPKSNNKLNKNKAAIKPNKENGDVGGKRGKTHDLEKKRPQETSTSDEETKASENKQGSNNDNYIKRVKELKIKEDYLKEKEKFLIEKEHDLLKKEIKLNKEKQNYGKKKADKNSYHKKEKRDKEDSSEEDFREYKGKFKSSKDLKKDKYKEDKNRHKEEKKKHSTQKRYRFSHEENRKRNISGQWYINLHEGRQNMRQKKRAGYKKNKANWYFQWMVDRARLRIK